MGDVVHVAAGKTRDGKTGKDRLVEGEGILRDRNKGMPISEMCAKYGLSRATVFRRIDEAIAARVVPTVDAYREQQNAVLDDLVRRWEQQVDAADEMVRQGTVVESMALVERGMKMRAEALVGILRVAERRSRLMGTDAPVRAEVTVTDGTPSIDARVAALAEEIKAQAGQVSA